MDHARLRPRLRCVTRASHPCILCVNGSGLNGTRAAGVFEKTRAETSASVPVPCGLADQRLEQSQPADPIRVFALRCAGHETRSDARRPEQHRSAVPDQAHERPHRYVDRRMGYFHWGSPPQCFEFALSIVSEDHCPVFPPPPACRDKLSPVLFHPYTRVLNKAIEFGQLNVVLDVSSRSPPPEIDNEETSEEGHGRIEHRSYFLSPDLSSLCGVAKWSGLKAIGMVQSKRHCGGRVSFEQRYFITSLGEVKLFQQSVRSHWGIENALHWRLDVTFREDESRIRRGNAPHNIGVIRHVAMNLLKREKTKISYRKKRIRAALNDAFRDNLLMGQ